MNIDEGNGVRASSAPKRGAEEVAAPDGTPAAAAKRAKHDGGSSSSAAPSSAAAAAAAAAAATHATIVEHVDHTHQVFLSRDTNQARGIAQYAIDFVAGEKIGKHVDPAVLKRVELFHTDSVVCGLSALALRTNAPVVLRDEALTYLNPEGATVFGSDVRVHPEKAICANSAAVREWDSNGTVFGFSEKLNHRAGEFGHNDFYPAVIAAAQMKNISGLQVLRACLALDEIRGRLAEVFSLKSYKIDHVVHGAIASAAVYGALMGATVDQIESAIGMCVAHYIPWRAIRAGKQLSDSKGASAALSTEVAIMSMHRSMRGFMGPRDIFRNPEAVFRQFEPQADGQSPFNLVLTHSGADFAIMGMHFKLGLYEHQSAGALQGVIDAVRKNPALVSSPDRIASIKITCYEPAFGIIGDPAKRNPRTRQSADHSMVFIVASKLRHALKLGPDALAKLNNVQAWQSLILMPADYGKDAIVDPQTHALMDKITFVHGGDEYDRCYPEGIPTSVAITDVDGNTYDSGMVMFPSGHARSDPVELEAILENKFRALGSLAVKDPDVLVAKLSNLADKSPEEIATLYEADIQWAAEPIDG